MDSPPRQRSEELSDYVATPPTEADYKVVILETCIKAIMQRHLHTTEIKVDVNAFGKAQRYRLGVQRSGEGVKFTIFPPPAPKL